MVKARPDILGDIPSYLSVPAGVFRSIDHYRAVIAGVTRGLARNRGVTAKTEGSYLLDGLQIEFSKHTKVEEIILDHLASKIVLRAPQKARESTKSLTQRRIHYLGQLLREVEAMRTIGMTQIYLTLCESGRRALEKAPPSRPPGRRRRGNRPKAL